jgi:hypothetical protein
MWVNNQPGVYLLFHKEGLRPRVSSGSLITDPVGAVARIANNMGIRTPDVLHLPHQNNHHQGLVVMSLPELWMQFVVKHLVLENLKLRLVKKDFPRTSRKLTGSGAATYRDAGSSMQSKCLVVLVVQ